MKRLSSFRHAITFLFFLLIAVGCRSTNTGKNYITSTVDPSYSKDVHKVFVLADFSNHSWRPYATETVVLANCRDFKEVMIENFKALGVTVDCETLTGLELDDSSYKSRLTALDPEAVLVITIESVTNSRTKWMESNRLEAVYDLSFFDAASGNRFWRGKIKMNSENVQNILNGILGKRAARILFSQITEKLKMDKVDVFGVLEPLQ